MEDSLSLLPRTCTAPGHHALGWKECGHCPLGVTGRAILVVIINHTASGLERLSDSAHPPEAPQQSPWQDGNAAVAGHEAQMPSGLELPADEAAVHDQCSWDTPVLSPPAEPRPDCQAHWVSEIRKRGRTLAPLSHH